MQVGCSSITCVLCLNLMFVLFPSLSINSLLHMVIADYHFYMHSISKLWDLEHLLLTILKQPCMI